MLFDVIIIITAVALLGCGIYLHHKYSRFDCVTGVCQMCEDVTTRTKKTLYCATFTYMHQGLQFTSQPYASEALLKVGESYELLVNPENHTEVTLASVKRSSVATMLIGLVALVIGVVSILL